MHDQLDLESIDPRGDVREVAEQAGALNRRTMLRRGAIATAGVTAASGTFYSLLSPAEARISKGKKSNANDAKILNYALTLEYLEAAFYAQALANINFSFQPTKYFAQVAGAHEAAHVEALKDVLGSAAVDAPAVDFGAAVTDEATFLKTAVIVEDLGVSAYAGQGSNIKQLAVIRAAVSIHSVEARHAAWARSLRGGLDVQSLPLPLRNGAPAPNAYDEDRTEWQVLKAVDATGFLQ